MTRAGRKGRILVKPFVPKKKLSSQNVRRHGKEWKQILVAPASIQKAV
jgi:hypothetical protein